MSTPILTTKLYIPPTRPELVPRPRLIERLNEGLGQNQGFGRKLTLISAPAGFGKTTLISEWVDNLRFTSDDYSPRSETERDLRLDTAKESQIVNRKSKIVNRIAWLSLDEGDNDPARFLAYFVAALQTIEANIGKGALSALHATQPQPPPAETLLTSLINEIAAIPDRIVLVLDDYHLIESQPIHQALTFLLDHLPPQMHLVITTRSDPFLPLSRLRARNQMTDIRADDLRFSPQETATFFNQVMGLGLSGDDIATLENRTEGWVTGLQLTAIAIQSHLSMPGQADPSGFISTFAGDDRHIVDYLVDEVLSRQPEPVQDFLLQTSILERFSSPLCDAVLSRGAEVQGSKGEFSRSPLLPCTPAPLHIRPSASSQEILEYLERANLFIIPLDNRRQWYRYHHLFADLLRQRLRENESERIFELHRRASEWYECNGLINEAIEHTLAAEDFERAARLINKLAETMWAGGEHATLWRWLEALSDELVCSRPQLCTFQAWMLYVNGKLQAAEQSLKAAEQALDSMTGDVIEASADVPDRRHDLNVAKQRGMVAAIRAFMASWQGDVPGIIQFSQQALEYFPEEDSTWRCSVAAVLGDAHFWRGDMVAANRAYSEAMTVSKAAGDIFQIMIAGLRVAKVERLQGRLRRVTEICRYLSQFAKENGVSQTSTAGWLLAIWAEVLYEWNDLDQAKRFVEKCVKLSEQVHDMAALGWGYLALVKILYGQDDLAGALGIIQKMEKTMGGRAVTWYTNRMIAWKARIWIAQGNDDPSRLEAATQLLQERGLNQGDEISYLREAEYMSLARLLIAQGKRQPRLLEEATRLLERLHQTAEAGDQVGRVIEILVLCALVLQAQGNSVQAMTPLKQALSLGEPEGYVRTFVDEGASMKALLRQAMSGGVAQNYVSKLLAAFDNLPFTSDDLRLDAAKESQIVNPKPVLNEGEVSKIANLVEPLSERELQVLRLLKTELSGPEIARELMIALSTMRTHTQNIYSKLNVNNRRAAVNRAEELDLI